jgi:predicted Rossmann fold flavoprotein
MQIVVVGGGAAAFFGAIACAEANPQAQITILEGSAQLLSKVKISGGGRCNVTHACFDPSELVQYYPRGGKALRGAFSRFQPKDTVAWFRDRGVKLKTEADGRMFPITDSSETIIDALIQAAKTAGVRIQTHWMVMNLEKVGDRFLLTSKTEETIDCDRVLLATGSHSMGYRIAQRLGHSILQPVPSLFTFNVRDPRLQDLAGISVEKVEVQLQMPDQKALVQTGPLLITHWGFSGPAILKLSAWGARVLYDARYRGELRINWVPELKQDQLREKLQQAKATYPKRAIANYAPINLPQRLWQRLVAAADLSPEIRWADCPKPGLNQLLRELQQGQYSIQGKGVFKEEFVTCGGVALKEINFKTMESRCCPGLFLAGELLDVDAVTGGFNFQNAWTTGWIAGQSMALLQTTSEKKQIWEHELNKPGD